MSWVLLKNKLIKEGYGMAPALKMFLTCLMTQYTLNGKKTRIRWQFWLALQQQSREVSNSETGGKGVRAQPLKEWHSCWGYDKNWLEPTKPKMVEDSTFSGPWASLYAHCNILAYAKWQTHRCHDSSKANHKRPKSGWRPNSQKSPPLPQNSWNNPPTL